MAKPKPKKIVKKVQPKPKPKPKKGAKPMPSFSKKPEAEKPAPKVFHVAEEAALGCEAPVDGKPCGKELAPGQNHVCADHVRKG